MKLNKDWKFKETFPRISAYVTAYNCIKNGYPIDVAVKSFSWCDEVVVVDGGSTDETKEVLSSLEMGNLNVYDIPIDWGNPGKDGQLKAMARAMCMGDVLIQFDADEICLGDRMQWKKLAKDLSHDILELPVLEPIGDIRSLRLNKEHNPLKWRVTKSRPEITHGIPKADQFEKDGKIYSKGGSDGCSFVHIVTGNPYPSYVNELGRAYGRSFLQLSENFDEIMESKASSEALSHKLFIEGMITSGTPCVLHVGHVNLENKIKLFLNEWRHWWAGLYGKDPEDISMYFPGKKVKDIEVGDIEKKADEIFSKTPTLGVDILEEAARSEGYCL